MRRGRPSRPLFCPVWPMTTTGADAMLEAAARADQLLEDCDPNGAATWHRILDAIEPMEIAMRLNPNSGPDRYGDAVGSTT